MSIELLRIIWLTIPPTAPPTATRAPMLLDEQHYYTRQLV